MTITNQPIVVPEAIKQQDNNSSKPLTGFQIHPENINRHGRPKRDWTWKSLLEKAMEEASEDGNPVKYKIAQSLIQECIDGNIVAIREVMNRMDGLPKQKLEAIGKDGEPLYPLPILGSPAPKD